ncbi:uncharacterized protein LOC111888168 [Lactuca sativa]|uniref:uncharacterized protein LOC111888168 n=1 Tax=Lactuca sativa TaxID=4236 RepID=UPI000CD9E444|nr:uncharacterized protein LOC111888168 [Lactuca sativa]
MAMKVQLQNLSKGSLSMIDYIQRKWSIADSLAENLHPVPEEDLISYILTGLDSSYAAFATTFMMQSDNITVDDLVGFLLQEEAQIEHEHTRNAPLLNFVLTVASPISSSTALAAQRSSTRVQSSQNNSHASSPQRNPDNRRHRPMCQLCSRLGHEAIDD